MKADFLQEISIKHNFITFIRCHNTTFPWRKYSIKALVVSWWRSNTKEVNNWAQCGTYFNANICMISFSKEKISRPLCQIANQRSWPTIYASLYHHSYSTMLKNSRNNSFVHQTFCPNSLVLICRAFSTWETSWKICRVKFQVSTKYFLLHVETCVNKKRFC